MKEIFKSASSVVTYDEATKLVRFELQGYLNPEDVKAMCLTVMDFIRKNKAVSFLHDFRKMKGTFTAITGWIIQEMSPAIELGLKYDAMIVNDDIFTTFAIEDFIKKTPRLQIMLFQQEAEAMDWINRNTAG